VFTVARDGIFRIGNRVGKARGSPVMGFESSRAKIAAPSFLRHAATAIAVCRFRLSANYHRNGAFLEVVVCDY
jgi:hypothetical protein